MINRIYSARSRALITLKSIGLSWILVSCGGGDYGSYYNQEPPVLPVIQVKKGNYESTKSFPAVTEGLQEVEIRAKVSGYIQDIYIDEGQYVEQGQPLFKLEANQLSQNAEAAKAAIETARANVESAKIEVANLRPLVKKDIVSKVQLSNAEAKLVANQAQLEQAKSNYQALQASVQYTRIVSPISGYVGKLNFKQGALVGPATVTALTTLSNTSDLLVYFSMSPKDLQDLTHKLPGQDLLEKLKHLPPAQFFAEDLQVRLTEGIVEAYTGKINTQTGAIQMRARFENDGQTLFSGTQGSIELRKEFINVIGIPASSAFKMQGLDMVYTLGEGDTLQVRPIQIAEKTDRYYLIQSGLNLGETILAQGVNTVYPNSVIVPQPTTADSVVLSYQSVYK
ncbi:efflux RND transporter periplasmic adaptor subunit [bacterium SCSIO 12741]|nr:efflux RND transporter periplasmic adaptor subunit [bacterium SCSIO 12741]